MKRAFASWAMGVAVLALLAAACAAPRGADLAPPANPDVSVISPPTTPEYPATPGSGVGKFYGGVISVTWSACTVDAIIDPINTNRIRFSAPSGAGGVARKTILDIGKLDDGHSVDDLEAFVEGLGRVEGGLGSTVTLEEQVPEYFDTSIQGRVDVGWPHGGMGPGRGLSRIGLEAGWWGTWVGPRGGATPGLYAVICYQHSAGGWNPTGVAGPVEVR